MRGSTDCAFIELQNGPFRSRWSSSVSVTRRRPTPSSSVDLLLSLPQSPLSIYILFDLYLYSEGTQASTLWRVSSWSPFRSCSFQCFIISVDSHPHC